jgi:hypothetical protein
MPIPESTSARGVEVAHYLLTGAGFSRNWGCWLADEVFDYLLADPQLTPQIRTQLWRDKNTDGNYENTIAVLRSNPEQHRLLLSILAGMFNRMRNAYAAHSGFRFEWTTDRRFQIHPFLQHFDAIFTLNQDTLLEHYYLTEFLPTRPDNRWAEWEMPGLKHTMTASGRKEPTAPKLVDGTPFSLGGGQPYLKLHGSHDWTTSSGYLLITGGNKGTDIGEIPLLTSYLTHFRTSMCNEHARLMIVGYGFGDRHINSILMDASRKRQVLSSRSCRDQCAR